MFPVPEQARRERVLRCGGGQLELGRRTLIMGILNATPDSFSDGGRYMDPSLAVERALHMVEEGADIIDVGGESTRPGAVQVPVDEEMSRVLPVLEAVVPRVRVPVSIDTYKAEVARAAVQAGASIVNDIWGLRYDPQMAPTVASLGVPVVIMHNQSGTDYPGGLLREIKVFFEESIALAQANGISLENIILDPGFGFGKTAEQNLEVTARLNELADLGFPILLGPSRKSTIGKVLDLPVEERVEGTAALVALGIAGGAEIVRVHDVRAMARVARMADAVVRPGYTHRSRAFIGLGSNLGDRKANIASALEMLKATPGIEVNRVSSIYETEPIGVEGQGWFMNAVAELDVSYSPEGLLLVLKDIEGRMGREPGGHLKPRVIDLDLLLFGYRRLSQPGLLVPHPFMWERAFVLIPLLEIAPNLVLPGGETLGDFVKRVSDRIMSQRVLKLSEQGV